MMLGSACGAEWGRDGFIDRAVAKDIRENARHRCAGGKEWRRSLRAPDDCGNNDRREACRERCLSPGE